MYVDEDVIMPRSFLIKKTNYSHCPLKKRPVQIFKDEPAEDSEKDMSSDISEPENLSTKPEDLSLASQHPKSRTPPGTPPAGVALTTKRAPQEPVEQASSHPLAPPHFLAKSGGPLEPLNLNTPADPHHPLHYGSWHRQVSAHYPPHYLAAFNYPYPPPSELYHQHQYPSTLYPVSPIRHHEQLSPYAPRESTRSPTHPLHPLPLPIPHRHHLHHATDSPKLFMPYQPLDQCGLSPTSSIASSSSHAAFHSLSPPPATPEDLSSPGSMSSGSSSAGSVGIGKKRKEPVAPRYQCPDCAKSYSTYSGLSKHQQFHCAATAGAQVKKAFSCKYCEKVYVSLGALKMHIRTHTLPCKCKLCGKAFSRPWLLQGHIRTHTGEKPFSCQHCNRAFADRSNLRAHLQTHSDVKKYSCVSCSKTFSRMSLLTKHMDGGCPGVAAPHLMHMDAPHCGVKREDAGDEGHLYP